MCDGTGIADHGWKGWQELPQLRFPDVERQGGPWVDLSHRLNNDLPRVSFFPKPSFRLVMQIPNDPINVTEIQMVVHVGTHVALRSTRYHPKGCLARAWCSGSPRSPTRSLPRRTSRLVAWK